MSRAYGSRTSPSWKGNWADCRSTNRIERQRVLIPSGTAARVAFWTVVAATREALLDLIDKHHDRNAFDRAKTLAWTQAQVQLRHLDIEAQEAADFQRMAAPILYADPAFRAIARS